MLLVIHVLLGLIATLVVYPMLSVGRRQTIRRAWSRVLLAIVGVRLEPIGQPIAEGSLLIANHVSWLDIFVINAIAPSAFISKAEVRQWPLIGLLSARNETVFLMRGSRGHAQLVGKEIAAILNAGRNAALFPEGTTTDGRQVLHFHSALLQPAIDAERSIQPIAITYCDTSGVRSLAPAYDGDISLMQCLNNIIGSRGLVARLHIGQPIASDSGKHRKQLAEEARSFIRQHVEA